jgi:hypothetical protein
MKNIKGFMTGEILPEIKKLINKEKNESKGNRDEARSE